MALRKDDNADLSPTSPGDESSDAVLSPDPPVEIEPVPGLNGVPVRCMFLYPSLGCDYVDQRILT